MKIIYLALWSNNRMSPTHAMSACVIRDDPPATLLCYNLYRSSGLHLLTLGRRIPRIVMHQHQ